MKEDLGQKLNIHDFIGMHISNVSEFWKVGWGEEKKRK